MGRPLAVKQPRRINKVRIMIFDLVLTDAKHVCYHTLMKKTTFLDYCENGLKQASYEDWGAAIGVCTGFSLSNALGLPVFDSAMIMAASGIGGDLLGLAIDATRGTARPIEYELSQEETAPPSKDDFIRTGENMKKLVNDYTFNNIEKDF